MVSWEAIYVYIVLVLGFVCLVKDWISPDFVMVGMLALCMTARIVDTKQALQGFSNEGLLTVVVLFVVAAGISETGGLDHFFGKVLGTPTSTSAAQIRMMVPIALISAFLNNTPVVAIMIPIILYWCQKAHLHPGQLFIPLSFASILGGTVTLIGTSTNLVIAGLQADRFPESKIGLFDLSIYGVPVMLWGLIYIVLFSPFLLPGGRSKKRMRRSSTEMPGVANFMLGLQVPASSSVANKTIESAGLRGLDGLYLASVKRDGTVFHAVGPEFVLAAWDVLYFTGMLDKVQELANYFNLIPITDEDEDDIPPLIGSPKLITQGGSSSAMLDDLLGKLHSNRGALLDHQNGKKDNGGSSKQRTDPPNGRKLSSYRGGNFLQAVVRDDAEIIGQTVREVGFRSRFSAAIISIHRDGERIGGKLGDIVLEAGDFLVVDAAQEFSALQDDVMRNLSDIRSAGNIADKEFMVAMQIIPNARLIGLTIERAGLRGLPQVFLTAIERKDGSIIHAAPPDEILLEGDVLWFAGAMESVNTLRKIPGLESYGDQVQKLNVDRLERRLVQVVISAKSNMIGKSVKEIRFRTKYNAAIIGVHRQGHRLRSKIGEIVLEPGDVLLLDTGADFVQSFKNDTSFALVSEVENSSPPRFDKVLIACLAAVAMVIVSQVSATGISLINAGILAAAVMLFTKCLSGDQARNSIKWDVYITIAAAFGVSNALEDSGGAKAIANLLVSIGKGLGGDIWIMVAIYIATALLSNIVANNAAAALMYPIASQVASDQGIDQNLMSFLLMLGASAAFASPFGYQTNLMVYAAGGYTTMDFIRFGGPMQIWQGIVSVAVIGIGYLDKKLWPVVWVVSFAATVLVFFGATAVQYLQSWLNRRSKRRLSAAQNDIITPRSSETL
eukprot:TRINITY_DN140_c1_g1_i2.p1 TRINITY_DN140_c1_g1~~TRINITY_DN140_c1_g1_i2.p1  ORF type:complete len:897 (-),score=140.21 TRINITY_DN140_c1_g1_i2:813-3503(-)